MLNLGYDQADGLKRLFRPAPGMQMHVLAGAGCDDPWSWATALSGRLAQEGVDATVAAPPAPGVVGAPVDSERRVLLSPAWMGKSGSLATQRSQQAILIAQPDPNQLPAMYGALKRLDKVLCTEPVLVVWHASHCDENRHPVRALCETNFARTVAKFLNRTVTFKSFSGGIDNAGSSAHHNALDWMSMTVVRRLEGFGRPEPALPN